MIVTGPTRSIEIHGETPAGAVDGVNAVFATSYSFRPQTERVYLNGVRQRRGGDYSVNAPSTFTFVYPPRVGDVLLVDYAR